MSANPPKFPGLVAMRFLSAAASRVFENTERMATNWQN